MTLTDLEELEALHAGGSALAWKAEANEYHADSGAHEVTIDPLASEEECVNLATSINALHNAFPAMAVALRGAWKEREDYRNDAIKAEANEEKATDALHVAHALLSYLVEELAVVETSSQKLLVALSSQRLVRLREQARTHLLATMDQGSD